MEEKLYQVLFGPAAAIRGKSLPSYHDVRFNASLMLGNSHVSLGQATRLPQSYKPIAGYHIDPDLKPLPEVRYNLLFCKVFNRLLNRRKVCKRQINKRQIKSGLNSIYPIMISMKYYDS